MIHLIVKPTGIHVTDGEVTVICQNQEQAAKLLFVKHCIFPKELKGIEGSYPIPGLRFKVETEEVSNGMFIMNREVAILSVEVETVKPIHYTLQEIIAFAKWYSGMDEDKVKRAYERYLRETRKETKEESQEEQKAISDELWNAGELYNPTDFHAYIQKHFNPITRK